MSLRSKVFFFVIMLLFVVSIGNIVCASEYSEERVVGIKYGGWYDTVVKVMHINDSIYVVGEALYQGSQTFQSFVYVAKIYSNGSIAWYKVIGNSSFSYMVFDATYYDDDIYILSWQTNGTISKYLLWGLIIRVGLDGSVKSILRFNNSAISPVPRGFMIDNGYAYIVGYIDPGTGWNVKDSFIAKIDLSSGNTIWFKVMDLGSSTDDYLYDVYVSGGSVYAVGWENYNGGTIVLKMTPDGSLQWIREYNLPSFMGANIFVNDSSIYISGISFSEGSWSAVIMSGEKSPTLRGGVNQGSESYEAIGFLAKLNESGYPVWVKLTNTTTSSEYYIPSVFGALDIMSNTLYVAMNTESEGYIARFDPDGNMELLLHAYPTGNASVEYVDLEQGVIGGYVLETIEYQGTLLQVPVPYVMWDNIIWEPVDSPFELIDFTDNVSVTTLSISPTDNTLECGFVTLPVSGTTPIYNPLTANLDIHVEQPDINTPIARISFTKSFLSTLVDQDTVQHTPDTTGLLKKDYGWIVLVENTSVIYSPVRITGLYIGSRSVTILLEKKANISIVVPQNMVEKILVDNNPVCESVNACESLRDTDNVIVVDPSNVTIVFTQPVSSGEGGSVLREGAGIGGGHGLGGEVTGTCYLEASIVIVLALAMIGLYMAVIAGRK